MNIYELFIFTQLQSYFFIIIDVGANYYDTVTKKYCTNTEDLPEGTRNECDTDEQCLENAREYCDDDPKCFGVQWCSQQGKETQEMKKCLTTVLEDNDGWHSIMKVPTGNS